MRMLCNFWEATRGVATLKMDNLNLSYNQWIAGDVNNDTEVDLADAIIALRVLTGINIQDVYTEADVSGDDRIGLEEAIYALQTVVGMK